MFDSCWVRVANALLTTERASAARWVPRARRRPCAGGKPFPNHNSRQSRRASPSSSPPPAAARIPRIIVPNSPSCFSSSQNHISSLRLLGGGRLEASLAQAGRSSGAADAGGRVPDGTVIVAPPRRIEEGPGSHPRPFWMHLPTTKISCSTSLTAPGKTMITLRLSRKDSGLFLNPDYHT
ncbi:uncharacterized protein [Triticum aestivum]|uniref:uncharacterized protein n=1 Tax=Triticum aestivum TaxID=4565 RepID=UPI001D0211B7|nr:uncharacterized protein LOC123090153 [Triticum aestivum]